MIVVRLAGGLGNQIFQVGAALLLQNNKKGASIYADDFFLSSYSIPRRNDLLKFFKLDNNVIFKHFFVSSLRVPLFLKFGPFLGDKNYSKDNTLFPIYILDGYFQDCFKQDEFEEMASILKSLLIEQAINTLDYSTVVVHIRGGDFVSLGWNSVCDIEYYQSAINYFKEQHGISHFTVVTDDKVYATQIMDSISVNYIFTDGGMASDFYQIANIPYRILSSSTFAFWASALGQNPLEGEVIAPSNWTPDRERNIKLPNEIIVT